MRIFLIIILFFSALMPVIAQESQQKPTSAEPLDLPNFIIQGTLQLNVNSGVKQNPERPRPLSKSELDSLNSLEKQSSQSLPVEPLRITTVERSLKDGFVKAQFGRFATGQIDVGFGGELGGYDLYGQAGYEFSDGHLTNADFSKFGAKLTSDYIAPAKFFIFGGSRTRTEVEFKHHDYNLFANPIGLNRNINNFSAIVDVDGNYRGIKFETGMGFNGFQVVTDNFRNADNNIFGFLKIHSFWNNFQVAGNVLLDLHTLRGQSTNFMQADGSISIFNDVFSLTGNGGLQWATNSNGVDRGGLLIEGKAEYRMNKLFTVRADIRSGLENKSFRDMAYENPYISNMADLDFAYDIMNLGAYLIFHPNEKIGFSAGMRVRSTDRYPVFSPDEVYFPGSFNISYEGISFVRSMFETYWYFTSQDKLTANLTATQSSLNDFTDSSIPYIPDFQISLDYNRNWFKGFGTNFGIDYIGERFADLQNTVKLDSYINVRIEGNYLIYDGLRLFLRLDNLLNSDIYVWEGYRERNVFISFGVMWQF
ncbi:MAG: hypothetical protein KIT33_05325 [Candidatus Kapabacteria bacterium]|nr:hypothetical protein [Ignavibacteriota bacterium]MCW5884377.1 hypothetical protein [Candidatus Kapabacteria bacterium]